MSKDGELLMGHDSSEEVYIDELWLVLYKLKDIKKIRKRIKCIVGKKTTNDSIKYWWNNYGICFFLLDTLWLSSYLFIFKWFPILRILFFYIIALKLWYIFLLIFLYKFSNNQKQLIHFFLNFYSSSTFIIF